MFKKKNKTIIDIIKKNKKIFDNIKNNKKIMMLIFPISGTFFLYIPRLLTDRYEGIMIFTEYPYLLLPSLILFGLGIYFSSVLLLKLYNILLFIGVSLIFFIVIIVFYSGGLNLTL